MSFALEFAPNASSQWRELELTLQELTLDELDRTAAAGPHSRRVFVRDFTHPLGGLLHYVFLRVVWNPAGDTLVVLGVAHHARPIG